MSLPYEDSPFRTHLRNSKVTTWQIARILEMNYKTAIKYVKQPIKYFTLHDLIMISTLTNIHLLELVNMLVGNTPDKMKHWYKDYKPNLNEDDGNESTTP